MIKHKTFYSQKKIIVCMRIEHTHKKKSIILWQIWRFGRERRERIFFNIEMRKKKVEKKKVGC